jgi:hypothetical protein
VRIFAFDYDLYAREWQQILQLHTNTAHVSVVRAGARGNRKAILQQGVYTFSTVVDQGRHLTDRAHEYSATHEIDRKYLLTFDISVREKPLAMRELRMMGINAMTLFPTTEGVCKGLKEEYFPTKRIGSTPEERSEELMRILASMRDPMSQPSLPLPPPPTTPQKEVAYSAIGRALLNAKEAESVKPADVPASVKRVIEARKKPK